MKKTRIIAAFPGTGKSMYHKKYPDTTLDSDSSKFSWIEVSKSKGGVKERNPDFPQNYINHIKENIGKYDFIFVSTHREVREALLDNCIFFYLIYPSKNRKKEFIKRYQDRDNIDSFIKLLDKNWNVWIRECEFCEIGCKQVRMILNNLENEINHIIASETGDKKNGNKIMCVNKSNKLIECQYCKRKTKFELWIGEYSNVDRCWYYSCPICQKLNEG